MVDIISLECPLIPPVPVLYCVKKETIRVPGLSDKKHDAVAKNVHGIYTALRKKQPLLNSAEDDRKKAMSMFPESRLLVPQKMSGEIGIDIMPYNKTQKYGWIWTYATLLVHEGTDEFANARNKGIVDDGLVDCICRMMAHRPADRIDIQDLQEITRQTLNEDGPEPDSDSPFTLEENYSRDEDMFTDETLQVVNGILTQGIPVYNYGISTPGSILPFPFVGGSKKLLLNPAIVRAVRGDSDNTVDSNRTSRWNSATPTASQATSSSQSASTSQQSSSS